MLHRTILTATLLAMPATAQTPPEIVRPEPADATVYVMPKIPTEAEKIEALKLAYVLNGNSMVGPTIDLTDPKVLEAYRNSIVGSPETIEDSGPGIWPKLETPKHIHNVCTAHGMYKQYYGTSWRCKR
jgi:hypothetical protein